MASLRDRLLGRTPPAQIRNAVADFLRTETIPLTQAEREEVIK